MLNKIHAHIVSYVCYYFDILCRNELHIGHITTERDYVSNLCSHLRHPLGAFLPIQLAAAYTLPGREESLFGCDSIIIFKKKDIVKIGLFEAKWPRYFKKPIYSWDSNLKTGGSRFSSQINRQHRWRKSGAAIWEMFFNESASGLIHPPFDAKGSSCVLHHHAYKYMNSHKLPSNTLWDNKDLIFILQDSINFKRIIYGMLICRIGKTFKISNNHATILPDDKKNIVEIPIFSRTFENKDLQSSAITRFMEYAGISNYLSFDIRDIE